MWSWPKKRKKLSGLRYKEDVIRLLDKDRVIIVDRHYINGFRYDIVQFL